MRPIGQWFKRRFKELDHLEEYFPLLFTRWQAAIWGGSVLAVAFGWRFITSDWPYPVKLTACVVALFFAGYYVWRADHLKLIPKLEVKRFCLQRTRTTDPNEFRVYVQVIPECLTKAPVNGCLGKLLRVRKRSAPNVEWETTELNEPLDLEWSYDAAHPLSINPGVGQRLNVCWISNIAEQIVPTVSPLPLHYQSVFNHTDTFRFDIHIIATDCPPVDVSLSIRIGDKWDKPFVEICQ